MRLILSVEIGSLCMRARAAIMASACMCVCACVRAADSRVLAGPETLPTLRQRISKP